MEGTRQNYDHSFGSFDISQTRSIGIASRAEDGVHPCDSLSIVVSSLSALAESLNLSSDPA